MFSRRASVAIDLDDALDPTIFQHAVEDLRFHRRNTRSTAQALDAAASVLQSETSGRRPGVHAAVIVITDGPARESDPALIASAGAVRAVGADVFALGILPGASAAQLSLIVSRPFERYLHFTDQSSAVASAQTVAQLADAIRCP